MEKSSEKKQVKIVKIKAIEATPENFQDYGQIIEPIPDGQKFGPQDAQLDLSKGTPRLQIMHLEHQPLKFSCITFHGNVTQCLGSAGGDVWYLGVAKASMVDPSANFGDRMSKNISKSRRGRLYVPPTVEEVSVFRISGTKFVKLHFGTWHAGPLFLQDAMDFYNLELTDTNEVDHTTHYFSKENGVSFVIDDDE